jgi:hypothetical protein
MPSLTGMDMARWPIVLRHDAEHDCVISSYRGCSVLTRDDVRTFLAGFYAELRRYATPTALVAIYDGMHVAPDVMRYFAGGRMQAVARIGGPVYRVAATAEARTFLATPGHPEAATISYPSLQAALAQLVRDRISAR